jgi:hypothetical protein
MAVTVVPAAGAEPKASTTVPVATGPAAVTMRAAFQQNPCPVARLRVENSSGRQPTHDRDIPSPLPMAIRHRRVDRSEVYWCPMSDGANLIERKIPFQINRLCGRGAQGRN